MDMAVITICAIICGADDWEAVAEYGQAKEEWFFIFLACHQGIPTHDTFCLCRRTREQIHYIYFLELEMHPNLQESIGNKVMSYYA